MGMFDYVRFSEDWIKKLEIPDTSYQTKDFDEPFFENYLVSDDLCIVTGNVFTRVCGLVDIVCYTQDTLGELIHVSVVAMNGVLLSVKKIDGENSLKGKVACRIPNLQCPVCSGAQLFIVHDEFICGNCLSNCEIEVRTKGASNGNV